MHWVGIVLLEETLFLKANLKSFATASGNNFALRNSRNLKV